MIINRHNYENFFLLYVDDELSAEEQAEVEAFVLQNADLAGELASFKEVILSEEAIEFKQKEELYKHEDSISLANYQNYFLLYIDKELNEATQQEVEKFVLKHPELQDEFTLLQKTILKPQAIVFKRKELLFKKERRTIPIVWMRIAVAASVTSIIAFSWMWSNKPANNASQSVVISKVHTRLNKEEVSRPDLKPAKTEKFIALLPSKEKKHEEKITIALRQTVPLTKVVKTKPLQPELAKNPIVKLKIQEETPKKADIDLASDDNKREEEMLANNPDNVEIAHSSNGNITSLVKQSSAEATIATNAVYKVVDNDDEDKSFYIGSAEINKNKLKGLFKKATALFDKKSKGDDKKVLQIAGFQIGG